MIDPKDFSQRSEALAQLLHDKLGLRWGTLSARLKSARPDLPKRLRRMGQVIVDAEKIIGHPKLALIADPAPVHAAFDEITQYLKDLSPTERRKTTLLRWLAGNVFNIILVIVLALLLLRWQGAL